MFIFLMKLYNKLIYAMLLLFGILHILDLIFTFKGISLYGLDMEKNEFVKNPGVAPTERSRLFAEFPKISNRPTAGERSTGLGLAIVKALAEAQGGRVGAEFPNATGSVFWAELPLAESEP